jgi:flagellar hook-length control protein FliK
MAQFDAAQSPPSNHDTAAPPAPAQALAEFSPNQPQSATPPAPVSSSATPTTPVAQSQADNATPAPTCFLPTGNVPADEPAPQTGAEPAPVPKLAVAPTHPKDENPAPASTDAGADASTEAQTQGDVPAVPEIASPLAMQILDASSAPAPQTAPAPGTPSNPAPQSTQALTAALPAAIQTPPRSALSDKTAPDKTGTEKNASTSDTKANPTAPSSRPRESQASASVDPAPSANDSSASPVKTAEPPLEHTARNETAPPATNLPQTNPTPSSAPIHTAPDVSAAAPGNAPPAPTTDLSTPVRIAFATPLVASAPSFDALALKIASRSANGENNFTLRLDPPELGRIEVHLNVNSDGHAAANLSADKPQTLELLQKDASGLERALKDAGLNLAGGMTFSLKGDGRSAAWRDTQNGARGRNIQITGVDAANANAAIQTSAALAARAYGLPVALLDIRV